MRSLSLAAAARRWALAAVLGVAPASAYAAGYVPPDAATVTDYSATLLPCRIVEPRDRDVDQRHVECKDQLLEKLSLRELAIRRNTIFARYGWDGFRKPWLRDYFHAQPWFKPNPAFHYKLLSDVDRKNAHLIAAVEQLLTGAELRERKQRILDGHHGDPSKLTPDEKIEIGLLDRAMGTFAVDEDTRTASESSLDRLLKVDDLRKLSVRDLRLLRNTIYARHGRTFKSHVLQDHFDGLDWYKVDPTYSDAKLTRTDERNVALIRTVENELGGPISDEEWLTEPADGA